MLIYKANETNRRMAMMKQQLIEGTRKEAEKKAPWAAKIVKVEGGYMAFESINDYKVWIKQK